MNAASARGFPAFAPRKSRSAGGRTRWGRAWTDALEDSAPADEPLRKGRAYAFPERGPQLRYGHDGRWYPYREYTGDWWPADDPDRDPGTALAEAH
jgi:hypothetical protein